MSEFIGIVIVFVAPLVAIAMMILGLFCDEIRALFDPGND
jgi:hypothetical protein